MPLFDLLSIQAKLLALGSGVLIITPSARAELFLALEDLQRRNLRPMVVLIKSETFGGRGSTENMVANLQSRNIPVCQIGFGDDPGAQLALPAAYFQRSRISNSNPSMRM
jgi:hypothetical protein